jgi:Rrf2 family protein
MQPFINKLSLIIEAILYIAYNDETSPVGGKKLAEILGIPSRHLEPYLQNLGRGSLLTSTRGAKGGYKLARPAHDITLREICEIAIGASENDKDTNVTNSKICNLLITPLFIKATCEFWESLHNISLADLMREARSHKLEDALNIMQNDDNIVINFVI